MTVQVKARPRPTPADKVFRDLEPFFARKHIPTSTSARTGATSTGRCCRPSSAPRRTWSSRTPLLARLLTSVAGAGGVKPPVCHHLALAAAPGTARLRDADTMTRVIGVAGDPSGDAPGRTPGHAPGDTDFETRLPPWTASPADFPGPGSRS